MSFEACLTNPRSWQRHARGTSAILCLVALTTTACGDSGGRDDLTLTAPLAVGTVAVIAPDPTITPTPLPWPPWPPPLTVTPASGPVGTRIHVEGDGFIGPQWQNLPSVSGGGGYGLFLTTSLNSGGTYCDFIAGMESTLEVRSDGHLVADFTVPSDGGCFQTERRDPVTPRQYAIGLGCHVCQVGTFTVTGAK